MSVHRYFCCVIGRVKLENWHVYIERWHYDARTNGQKARWLMWDRIV